MAGTLASDLRDMRVHTDKGLRVGNILDLLVDDDTGKIEALVILPESKEVGLNLPTDEDGNVLVPFESIVAIGDYIVISERSLAAQHSRA